MHTKPRNHLIDNSQNIKNMKLQFFYLILGTILMASTNEHSVAKSGTHKVTCNKVHLREFPNFNSKSLELIEAGAQVTYLKESRFKEKITVNNQERIANWIFCAHNHQKGWIYGGCLEPTKGQVVQKVVDNDLQLSNRVVAFQEVPFENTANADREKCFFSSESDCGGGDLVFLNEKEVIMAFYCSTTSSYRKGSYTLTKDQLTCSFGKEEIFAEDRNSEEKFTVIKKKISPLVLKYSINYCTTGEIYWHHKMVKEKLGLYGVLSSQTVATCIRLMQEENAWQYLK